jgi:hypothetical protein
MLEELLSRCYVDGAHEFLYQDRVRPVGRDDHRPQRRGHEAAYLRAYGSSIEGTCVPAASPHRRFG